MRNLLAHVPRGDKSIVAAALRTIFAQPDRESASTQLRRVAGSLRPRFANVTQLLEDAEHELLAYMAFPREHWRQLYSTNPLERLNKEIKRRSDVVGIFPNEAAVLRLAGAVLLEVHDEWAIAERRYLAEGSMALLDGVADDDLTKEVDGGKSLLLAS